MSALARPLLAATALIGLWTVGSPVAIAAHAPQQDVLVGRVEVCTAPTPAWLGVKFQHVVARDSSRVVLASVMAESPAARAGLESGDRLLRVNGKAASMDLMASLGPRMQAGDPFTFTVHRDGAEFETSLVAEPRPECGDIMVTRMQAQLDTLRKLIGVSLDSLARSGVAALPSLEVRRVNEADGSVTLVVSTGETGLTVSGNLLADGAEAWSDAEHFVRAWARTDSARVFAPLARSGPGVVPPPASPERVEVRIRTTDARPGTVEVGGWSISSPLSPYEEGARRVAGAELHPVGPDLGRYLGIDRGLMVAEVTPGTPAAAAGLRAGDVLVSVDEIPLRTVAEFRELMSVPSRARALGIVRQGAEMELTLRH